MLDLISVVGSFASVIGLWLTWRVYGRVRQIQASYARQALLPAYLKNLAGHLTGLERSIPVKNYQESRRQLVLCRSNFRSIVAHVDEGKKIQLLKLVAKIDEALALKNGTAFVSRSKTLVVELQGEVQAIKNLVKELAWRQRDG